MSPPAAPSAYTRYADVHPLTVEIHETGLRLADRYGFSTYDAMIAASALHAGCDTLWSEDHSMALNEGLRIANPFSCYESRIIDPTAPFSDLIDHEMTPGKAMDDGEALRANIVANVAAYLHPTSTVPIGADSDSTAVVDP
jgi:choline dehydrogenase-like flavoprotein